MRLALVCGVAYVIVCIFTSKSVANEKKTKTEKIGKKVTDYNDIDVEKLLDQWNVSPINFFCVCHANVFPFILTLSASCVSESYIHTFLWYLKMFHEGLEAFIALRGTTKKCENEKLNLFSLFVWDRDGKG